MHQLSSSFAAVNRQDEALKLREEVPAASQRTLAPDHADTLSSMINLAHNSTAMNRRQEAAELYEQALAAQKRTLPADDPDLLPPVDSLAAGYLAEMLKPSSFARMRCPHRKASFYGTIRTCWDPCRTWPTVMPR